MVSMRNVHTVVSIINYRLVQNELKQKRMYKLIVITVQKYQKKKRS